MTLFALKCQQQYNDKFKLEIKEIYREIIAIYQNEQKNEKIDDEKKEKKNDQLNLNKKIILHEWKEENVLQYNLINEIERWYQNEKKDWNKYFILKPTIKHLLFNQKNMIQYPIKISTRIKISKSIIDSLKY